MKKILILLTVTLLIYWGKILKTENHFLSYSEYVNYLSNKEDFFLIIEKENCSDCIELENYIKSEKNIYKVELSRKKDLDEWSEFIKTNRVTSVPSMYQIKNGRSVKVQGEGNAKTLYYNYKNQLIVNN